MRPAFDSVAEFLAMGGHGLYVWLAYGVTYAVLGTLFLVSILGHRATRRELSAQLQRAAGAAGQAATATSPSEPDTHPTRMPR